MFDAIVHVYVAKIKLVGPVVPGEHLCCIIGYEETETGTKVVGCADDRIEISERDIAARMR